METGIGKKFKSEENYSGDYIVRASAAQNRIRAFAVTSQNIAMEAVRRHNTAPVASAALGRLLTAGVMMGAMMKGEKDLITISIKSDGPIGGLTVTADANGNVKGYANNPDVYLPLNKYGMLDIEKAVGIGVISVIKDIGLREPYSGDTILITSDIAQDLTYYFATSEQIPSSVGLSVIMSGDGTVSSAGGFIIQLMPGAGEEVIEGLETKISEIKSVTSMLEKGYTPEMMLDELLGCFDLEITDKMPAKFYCSCSKDRMAKALASVGKRELKSMVADGKPIEMKCHFCGDAYEFEIEELKELVHRAVRN